MDPSYRLLEVLDGTYCAICHGPHDSMTCQHAARFFAEGSGEWLPLIWRANDSAHPLAQDSVLL